MKNKKSKKRGIGFAFKVMGKGRPMLIISLIALVCALIASYMTPLVTGYAVDSVIGEVDTELPSFLQNIVDGLGGRTFFKTHFWVLPAIVVLLTIINGIFVFIRGKTMMWASEEFAKNMRNKMYKHLQAVPFDYHKHVATGDIIQRCTSDIQTVKRFISVQLIQLARAFLMVAVAG